VKFHGLPARFAFTDADGDIAYFHGNFIPKRYSSFDLTSQWMA
jgi:hypothetical protein